MYKGVIGVLGCLVMQLSVCMDLLVVAAVKNEFEYRESASSSMIRENDDEEPSLLEGIEDMPVVKAEVPLKEEISSLAEPQKKCVKRGRKKNTKVLATRYAHASVVVKNVLKKFFCGECNKGFSQKGGLKNHARVHTGERPFKCTECFRAFTQNCNLKRHKFIHTGEKPFKCEQCPSRFNRKWGLMVHLKSKKHAPHTTQHIKSKPGLDEDYSVGDDIE